MPKVTQLLRGGAGKQSQRVDCRAHVLSPSVTTRGVLLGGSGRRSEYDPSISEKEMVTVGNRTECQKFMNPATQMKTRLQICLFCDSGSTNAHGHRHASLPSGSGTTMQAIALGSLPLLGSRQGFSSGQPPTTGREVLCMKTALK